MSSAAENFEAWRRAVRAAGWRFVGSGIGEILMVYPGEVRPRPFIHRVISAGVAATTRAEIVDGLVELLNRE